MNVSDFTRSRERVVAFTVTMIIGLLLIGLIVWYGSRRPTDASLSWGEAMAGACVAFFLMFWVYGVVPHQWLTWADNELGWRSDALLLGPGSTTLENVFPMTISKLVVRDLIAVGIYAVFLGIQIGMWAWWNDRKKPREAVVPASRYGRPLVKQG